MDAETAYAIYVLAAVVFALPAYVACVFVYGAVVGIVAVVRHLNRKPAIVEIVTPVEAYVIPSGMSFEEFDVAVEASAHRLIPPPSAPNRTLHSWINALRR